MRTISIAKEFSVFPGGRTDIDGNYNGEKFRNEFLLPVFTQPFNEKVCIDFDGTRGYGSSFIDEAFGGLIRNGISKEEIFNKLEFKSSRKFVLELLEESINKACGKHE